jgi:hypothetical protein
MSKESGILTKLFYGFDAGHYDLPPELLARRQAQERINAAYRALSAEFTPADPADVRSRIVKDLIEAAGAGDIPTGYEAPFIEAQDATRRLSAAQSILSEARTEVAERTPWFAARLSEEILADYLRPAMAAVLDRVRGGLELAVGVPWGNQRALVMSEKKFREYHELVATAHDEYLAIRGAQHLLMTLTGNPTTDAYHTFGELRNMPAIWPTRDSGVESILGRAPWPDGIERVVWLVTSDADPWMPTAAECDAEQQARIEANPIGKGGVAYGDRR